MCQMVRYAYAAIKSKASHKVAKLSGGRCEIQQVHVIWCVLPIQSRVVLHMVVLLMVVPKLQAGILRVSQHTFA